eukprot:Blabericola_migrator_1__7262@NODE_368_length_9339_cov_86_801014_g295_i0_p5_GENE_NODE_368_length_9339_cov_86_801014_g295_i0NODE_368_length_9339_cov_86_801014_g295_i0_p5_ORF_typecomplete_len112_score19_39_NODE_368_length_9339_cov_86_801014_g295_i0127462
MLSSHFSFLFSLFTVFPSSTSIKYWLVVIMTEPSTIIISENRFKGARPAKLVLRDPSLFDISVADDVEDLSRELTKQKLIKVSATMHSPDHFTEVMSQAVNKGWLQTKDAN